jgi:cytochrome P450
MLAMHKHVQAKVMNELHEVFSSVDDPIDFETTNKLPYLEMVIKETLRLFPISAFTLRTSTDDFELDNYKIPAGANFFLSVFSMHRNPKFWGDDAGEFKPERFEPERIKNVHPYAYIPFSGKKINIFIKFYFLNNFNPLGGARYCIGSKYAMLFMKTCLSNFLRHYEVDTSLKFEELQFRVSVTLKILQETKISLKPRNF